MATTSYIELSPEQLELYYQGLQTGDRFVFNTIRKKVDLLSKKRKKGLTQKSYLPIIAEAWNLLTELEKQSWSNAGAEMNLNGYRLFVSDKSARIINELPGNAIPSLLHQSWVGNLIIESPASEIKIIQLHPRSYWISRKVSGKKGMYEPVLVTEDFALPFKISLNYKSELEIVNGENFAKFYAVIWHSYQGANIQTSLEISLGYNDDWVHREIELNNLAGYVVGYDLYFHLKGVRGNLYVDNVKSIHSGQNWVRDTFCKDIHQDFTRAFWQIPKHWAGVILPQGAWYESIYKDF
jgi:hypothetical protein